MAYSDQFNDGTVVTTQHFKDISDFAENANNTSNTIQLSFNQFKNIVTDLVGVVGTPNVYVDEDGRLNFENLKGEKGDTGTNGTDGVSIVSFNRTGLNHLEIRLSDDTIYDAGAFVGADGANGTNGADGANGLSVVGAAIVNEQLQLSVGDIETGEVTKTIAVTGRVQGRDGRGISSTSILSDGTLQVTYTDSTVANLGKVVGSNGYNGREVALRKTLVNDVYVIQYGYRSIGTSGELLPVSEWHYLADWDDISFITPPSGLGGATQISYLGSNPSLVGQIYTLNQMIEQGYVNAQDIDTLQTQALQITTNQTDISTLNNKVTLINNEITDLQNDKVDKIDGKGLSTNDYTDYYKGEVNQLIINRANRLVEKSKLTYSSTVGEYWTQIFKLELKSIYVREDLNILFFVEEGNDIAGNVKIGIKTLQANARAANVRWTDLKKVDMINDFIITVEEIDGSVGNYIFRGYLKQRYTYNRNTFIITRNIPSSEKYSIFTLEQIADVPTASLLGTTIATSSAPFVEDIIDYKFEPAYNSLNAIDYNKEYGYVIDDTPSAGATWGKIFSYQASKINTYATFVFDVNYGYLNRERVGRLKLYTRMEGDTNTLTEAYLYFESKSEDLDMSMFKVRRYDNKAEIYVKTTVKHEGVSLKLVQVLDEAGKTYLQDSTISNFTLYNVKNPTLTNTDIDNLSGEVTIPTLIPQTLNGNELTINGQTYNSTWFDDWDKLRGLIYAENDEVALNTTLDIGGEEIKYYNTDNSQTQVANFTELYRLANNRPTVLWSGSVQVSSHHNTTIVIDGLLDYDVLIFTYDGSFGLEEVRIAVIDIAAGLNWRSFNLPSFRSPTDYASATISFSADDDATIYCDYETHSASAWAIRILKVRGIKYD